MLAPSFSHIVIKFVKLVIVIKLVIILAVDIFKISQIIEKTYLNIFEPLQIDQNITQIRYSVGIWVGTTD